MAATGLLINGGQVRNVQGDVHPADSFGQCCGVLFRREPVRDLVLETDRFLERLESEGGSASLDGIFAFSKYCGEFVQNMVRANAEAVLKRGERVQVPIDFGVWAKEKLGVSSEVVGSFTQGCAAIGSCGLGECEVGKDVVADVVKSEGSGEIVSDTSDGGRLSWADVVEDEIGSQLCGESGSAGEVGVERVVDNCVGVRFLAEGGFSLPEDFGGDPLVESVVSSRDGSADGRVVNASVGTVGLGYARVFRNVRGDVGGYAAALAGVGDGACVLGMRSWVERITAQSLPKYCDTLVLATMMPAYLDPIGRIAYKMMAVIGDRAAAAAFSYKCCLRGDDVRVCNNAKGSILSNAAFGRAFVREGLDDYVSRVQGIDMAVGKSGGTAFEVLLGTVSMTLGLKAVDRVLARTVYVDQYKAFADAVVDFSNGCTVENIGNEGSRTIPVSDKDDYMKVVSRKMMEFKLLAREVTKDRYPVSSPELELFVRYGDAFSNKLTESRRMHCIFGKDMLELVLAVKCFNRGLDGEQFSNMRDKYLSVEALAKKYSFSKVNRLFVEESVKYTMHGKVSKAGAVYMLVACIGKRMSWKATCALCDYFELFGDAASFGL